MMLRWISLTLCLALQPALAEAQINLEQSRGRERVLLIFAPSRSDARWKIQNRAFSPQSAAFRERDLVAISVFTPPESLRRRFHLKPGQFRLLLIGKDGHVAFESSVPVALPQILARIDAMPMRREEIHEQELRRRKADG